MRDSYRSTLTESAHATVLIATLGVLTWVLGQPLLFPSIGPSAYSLATGPTSESNTPKNVIGGHLLGVVAGLVAYHTFASGLIATQPPPPISPNGLRLAASATVAIALTIGGMLLSELDHAPACATTLIVGLGLLTTVVEGAIIMAGIAVLVGLELALTRWLPNAHPRW